MPEFEYCKCDYSCSCRINMDDKYFWIECCGCGKPYKGTLDTIPNYSDTDSE